MEKEKLQQLLVTENEQLQKLNDIVVKAVEEEKLLSQKLYEFEDKNPPISSKIADSVASFGGSWKFIVTFILFMVVWILTNLYLVQKPFDPFPFILLNLFLSAIAAIQTGRIYTS